MLNPKVETLAANDERQYMIHENYEVYEKQGAPIGATAFHYHNFYEIIYVLEGEYSSLLENQMYHLKKGDFLLKKHDSSRRIILWVTKATLEELAAGNMDLTACFRGHDYCAYHFPIYYEEMLRGYLMKLALSEVVDGQPIGSKEVMDRGYLTLFFSYLNLLCSTRDYLFKKTI